MHFRQGAGLASGRRQICEHAAASRHRQAGSSVSPWYQAPHVAGPQASKLPQSTRNRSQMRSAKKRVGLGWDRVLGPPPRGPSPWRVKLVRWCPAALVSGRSQHSCEAPKHTAGLSSQNLQSLLQSLNVQSLPFQNQSSHTVVNASGDPLHEKAPDTR